MKLELKFDYHVVVTALLNFGARYRIILTSAILLLLGVFVLQRINEVTQAELDTNYRNLRTSEIKRVEFDQASIDEIVKLESTGVEIESDFSDRNNPFAN